MNIRRLKFLRNLRTTLLATMLCGCLLMTAAILYLNASGMPASWRAALEKEMSKQGIELTIKKLRYVPLRGIEATEVEVFMDSSRTKRMAYLERLVFDLDKTKAMRGIIRLTHIDLLNAELRLPVDPDQPEGDVINIKELNGQILLSKSRKFEIKQGRGLIDGIQLKLDAVILGFRPVPVYQEDEENNGLHRRFLREFVKEMGHWQLDPEHPPELTLKLEADANRWSALKCQFTFSCAAASRGNVHLKKVEATGNILNSLVSVYQLQAKDQRGELQLALDYDLATRQGNFDVVSSIDVPHFFQDLTGRRLLSDFALAESPDLRMRGQFSLPENEPMKLALQGKVATKNLLFRGSPLSAMSAEFSYRDRDFFFRNIEFKHEQGEMRGHVLQKDGDLQLRFTGDLPLNMARPFYRDHKVALAINNLLALGDPKIKARIDASLRYDETYQLQSLQVSEVRVDHPAGSLSGSLALSSEWIDYELESTFPAEVWKPFFPGQTLENVLANFSNNAESRQWVKLKGRSNRKDRSLWSVKGSGKVEKLSYRGVPIHSCSTDLDLRHGQLQFSNISVDYDYKDYELQKLFQGPISGLVRAAEVVYEHRPGLVSIRQLRGTVFPVPLLRMFAPKVADALTDYRFHVPPTLAAEGVIDVRNQGQTRLNVSVIDAKRMTWSFLGQPVVFSDVSSDVVIDSQHVVLNRLNATAFAGKVAGTVKVQIAGENQFDTDLRWNALDLGEISEVYQFEQKGYGTLTGRMYLKGIAGDTQSLQGEGLCSLEKGELFAVPIFGPLSIVISAVLADRRAGFERAKDAFCNFVIRKGVIQTNDFLTQTTSLKFTGNGKVDLNEKTIDMTMRMNARGLLGIVVLPFQPIIRGLFQFQGQGPMNKPKWEHVIFTSPPNEEEDVLLRSTPKRALRVTE